MEIRYYIKGYNMKLDSLYCIECGMALDLFFTIETLHGRFILCKNFPKCKNYLRPSVAACMQLYKTGLDVYSWQRKCHRCHKYTRVYTYFLDYQLQDAYACLGQHIGLGNISHLDKLMMNRYSTIKMCNTRHPEFKGKIATNVCEHCGAVQGYHYVVEHSHDANIEFEHNRYYLETIPCYPNVELCNELKFLD